MDGQTLPVHWWPYRAWVAIAREVGGEGKSFGVGRVNLDLNITDEIKKEWLIRELIRAVQSKRKEMGLKVKDKIKLYLCKEFTKHKKLIENVTGSKIEFKKGKEILEFEGKKYFYGVEKWKRDQY